MAEFARVSSTGWSQGDDSSASARVTATGWEQVAAAAGGGPTFIPAWVRQTSRFIGSGAASMYPRNAASPERIAIGAVVLIADGTVQTSGVSVKVVPQGGAASTGSGTVAYEEGVVHYTPTQAETNYSSFMVIAYKTACIPAPPVTIVTSASATAGYAGVDWSKVTAPTTTLALTGTTIATTQKVDVETIKTQAVTAAAGVTFPTSIASPTNITAATGVVLSGVTHTGAVIPTVTTLTGHTAQTGDSYARLGAPVGASISADIAGISAGSGLDAAGVRAAIGLASANLDTQLGAIDTVVDAVLVDTAEIGSAGAGLTALASAANLATVAGYLDTEIAAIKAKTDNLPASPAAVGDIPTALQNADALLNRDMSAGTDSGSPTVRTVRQALRFLRNKWSISGTTLTVTKEDDTTSSWTSTVSTTAGADPVTGNDPA